MQLILLQAAMKQSRFFMNQGDRNCFVTKIAPCLPTAGRQWHKKSFPMVY